MTMKVDIVTLFESFFESPLQTGLLGKAIEDERVSIDYVNPREFTQDVHRTVDDTPYGGGAGMVMKAPPVVSAIEKAKSRGSNSKVIMLTPQGRPLTQGQLTQWSELEHLVLVCGRYEGFDDRIREFVDIEVSVGDFVLTGGEYAALTLLDGVIRLLPGTLGNAASHAGDSFSHGLLEHPQYTRPASFRDLTVPEVLTSGDHAKIAAWRQSASLDRTLQRRPELLAWTQLSDSDREILRLLPQNRPPVCLAIGVDDRRDFMSLFEFCQKLILSFQLQSVFIIPKEGSNCLTKLSQQYSVWFEALRKEEFVAPPRNGSRKQWKADKEKAHQEFLAEQQASDDICILESIEDVRFHLGDSNFQWISYDPPSPPETLPLSAAKFRESAPGHLQVICFDLPLSSFDAWLSPVRIRAKKTRVSTDIACALVLDRLILEA